MTLTSLLSRKLIDGKYRQLINVTLAAKCIYSVDDVLNMHDIENYRGIGSKKATLIRELQNDIRHIIAFESGDLSTMNDDNNDNNLSVVNDVDYLPKECPQDATITELMTIFVREFCECIQECNPNNQPKITKAVVIKRKYIDGLSKDAILFDSQVNVTNGERVRQIYCEFSADIGRVISAELQNPHQFRKKYGLDNVMLHPAFVEKLRYVVTFMDNCPTEESFAKMLGCAQKSPIIDFALGLSNKKICNVVSTLLRGNFISPVDSVELKDGVNLVFDKLESEVEPYHEFELRRFLLSKIGGRKDTIVEAICKMMNNSPQFEKKDDKYQLTWGELHSVQTRVERILFENGGEMTKEEISLEYDRRLSIYGEKCPKVKNYRESNKIASVRAGVWCWRRNESVKRINVQEIVRSFVATNKRVSFEQVYDEVSQYVDNLKEKSIRTYITSCAYETSNHDFIFKECRKEFEDVEFYIPTEQLLQEIISVMPTDNSFCTLNEIQKKYEDRYCKLVGRGSRDRLMYKCCYNNKDIFESKKECDRGKRVYYRLRDDYDKVLTKRLNYKQNRPVNRKTEHTQRIINEAINILQSQDNCTMMQAELVKQLKPLKPKDRSNTLFYKILNDIIFVKSGEGKGASISLNPDFYPRTSVVEAETTMVEQMPTEQRPKRDDTAAITILTDSEFDAIKDGVYECIELHLDWIKRDGMEISNFKDAWNAFVQICGVRTESVKGAFQRTFRLLHRYLIYSTNIDERFYLYDELNRRYEEYISKISLDGDSTLSKQIELARDRSLLPPRDKYCNINKYISNLIYYRNGPAHKNGKTPPDSYMINAICQALTLYLYIADRAYIKGYLNN